MKELFKEQLKEGKKGAKKIIDEADMGIILITDEGAVLNGPTPLLLALYTRLTEHMLNLKCVNKERLDNAYNRAFKTDKELMQEFDETLNTLKEKLYKDLEDLKKSEK